jgi:hypothetical protein
MLAGGLLLIGMIGCASVPQRHLSPDFGEAYRSGFNAQIVNPQAPQDPAPAARLPGELSNQIYEKRYVKGMTEEKEEEPAGQAQNISTFRQ